MSGNQDNQPPGPVRWSTRQIRKSKGRQRLACLTAYDWGTAQILDQAGIPLILVGDSLGMTVLGYETTLPVTVEEMLHHTAAVSRGVQNALVVADMPFMSYQVSPAQALENAGRFIKEAGADAVKIEGAKGRLSTVEQLVQSGIPVLGHIGLTPQSIREMGGYLVQGRESKAADRLRHEALELEEAGAFALVLECVPAELAAEITQSISIPTIGIGAGPHCDGQVLVIHDALGLTRGTLPRFVKRYADLAATIREAVDTYRQEVENQDFPTGEHSY